MPQSILAVKKMNILLQNELVYLSSKIQELQEDGSK